jgi:hypothetical protein
MCPEVYLIIELWRNIYPMPQISKEVASQIAVEFLKLQKNTDRIDVAIIEEQNDGWMVRGTCPINIEGHPWVEKFNVVVDWKGKIKESNYGLL